MRSSPVQGLVCVCVQPQNPTAGDPEPGPSWLPGSALHLRVRLEPAEAHQAAARIHRAPRCTLGLWDGKGALGCLGFPLP